MNPTTDINSDLTPVPSWTSSQQQALSSFKNFLHGNELRSVFVLRGAAGTGKSTLVSEFVRQAAELNFYTRLTAPTGRAARVLGERTSLETSTIHRAIYSFDKIQEIKDKSEQPVFQFRLKSSDDPVNTIFFVDEASMVGDKEMIDTNLRFGSGCLLTDLIYFVFWAHPSQSRKLVLIGDHCQLCPVGEDSSPALDSNYLTKIHELKIYESTLQEIVRQASDSELVTTTTNIRKMIEGGPSHSLHWKSGNDLAIYKDQTVFEEHLRSSWNDGRKPHVICYKNSTVRDWNKWVRSDVLHYPEQPQVGDRIMVIRNHIQSEMMNGDFAFIERVGSIQNHTIKGVDLIYRDVGIRYTGAGGEKIWNGLLLENVLLSTERQLTNEEEQARWVYFKMTNPNLKPGSEAFTNAIIQDPHWNCLVAKYGYATTCHKGQGGEWDEVFVQYDISQGNPNKSTGLRWLYTAATRAKKILHFINPPEWDAATALTKPNSQSMIMVHAVKNNAVTNIDLSVQDPTAVTPEDFIESLVVEASIALGLDRPNFHRMQYLIRATWKMPNGVAGADIRYKSDGSISNLIWTGQHKTFKCFTEAELQARWWLKQIPLSLAACPEGVQKTISRLIQLVKEDNFEIRWITQPFVLTIVSIDPLHLEAGVARLKCFYKKEGVFTSKEVIGINGDLAHRLQVQMQRLV